MDSNMLDIFLHGSHYLLDGRFATETMTVEGHQYWSAYTLHRRVQGNAAHQYKRSI